MGEGEGRGVEEKVDVMEGNAEEEEEEEEEEDEEEEDVEERDVDEEGDDRGKTIGREFGGLESHREELPSLPNCSSVRMLAEDSCCELIRGARGEP